MKFARPSSGAAAAGSTSAPCARPCFGGYPEDGRQQSSPPRPSGRPAAGQLQHRPTAAPTSAPSHAPFGGVYPRDAGFRGDGASQVARNVYPRDPPALRGDGASQVTRDAYPRDSSLRGESANANVLLLSNLPSDWTDREARDICSQYGRVVQVQPAGAGRFQVTFISQRQADVASAALQGLQLPASAAPGQRPVSRVVRCERLSSMGPPSIPAAVPPRISAAAPPSIPAAAAREAPPKDALQIFRDAKQRAQQIEVVYVDELLAPYRKPLPEDCEVFLKNLPWHDYSKQELEEWLAAFGKLDEVHFLIDTGTRQFTGAGYVKFTTHKAAASLVRSLQEAQPEQEQQGSNLAGQWSLSEQVLVRDGQSTALVESLLGPGSVSRFRDGLGCPSLALLSDHHQLGLQNLGIGGGPLHFAWVETGGALSGKGFKSKLTKFLGDLVASGVNAAPRRGGQPLGAPTPAASSSSSKTSSAPTAPGRQPAAAACAKPPETAEESPIPSIVVRGFPKSWDENQVKMLFAAYGGVAMVNIMSVGNGRMAYVKLREFQNSSKAVRQLHNKHVGGDEFMEGCVISCQLLGRAEQDSSVGAGAGAPRSGGEKRRSKRGPSSSCSEPRRPPKRARDVSAVTAPPPGLAAPPGMWDLPPRQVSGSGGAAPVPPMSMSTAQMAPMVPPASMVPQPQVTQSSRHSQHKRPPAAEKAESAVEPPKSSGRKAAKEAKRPAQEAAAAPPPKAEPEASIDLKDLKARMAQAMDLVSEARGLLNKNDKHAAWQKYVKALQEYTELTKIYPKAEELREQTVRVFDEAEALKELLHEAGFPKDSAMATTASLRSTPRKRSPEERPQASALPRESEVAPPAGKQEAPAGRRSPRRGSPQGGGHGRASTRITARSPSKRRHEGRRSTRGEMELKPAARSDEGSYRDRGAEGIHRDRGRGSLRLEANADAERRPSRERHTLQPRRSRSRSRRGQRLRVSSASRETGSTGPLILQPARHTEASSRPRIQLLPREA